MQLNELSPSDIDQDEARAAYVWICGLFGKDMPGAPYLLEQVRRVWVGRC